jgi:integrase
VSKAGTPTRYPGVHRISETSYRVRGRVRDPKTGQSIDLDKIVEADAPEKAMKLRASLLAELDAPRVEAQERMRLSTYANSWLRCKLPTLKAATQALYAEVIESHIKPELGDYFVEAITGDDLARWRDAQKAKLVRTKGGGSKPTSNATVNCRLRVLKAMLRAAVDDLKLDRDPTRRLAAMREGKRKQADRNCLDADELRRFLEAARKLTPQWHPFFFTLAFSGMRFGELTALRWRDIDEAHGVIHIRKAQWKGIVDSTKTDDERSVPLFPELAAVLRAQHELKRLDRLRRLRRQQVPAIEPQDGADGLVFYTRDGSRHMHNTAPRKALAKCLAAAAVEHRVTVHGQRRTFNNLIRQVEKCGVVTRSMTGHHSEEMTEHYSFVATAEKQRAVTGMLRLVEG